MHVRLVSMTSLMIAFALTLPAGGHEADPAQPGCTPACRATWQEKKKPSPPKYTMKCEHACARGRDSWLAPPPECRCSPPCGSVYVKKRLYKTAGPEKVERVPKYEVTMVPAPSCGCPRCRGEAGLCWWDPLGLFGWLHGR